jgi:glutamine synthetase
MEHILEQAQKDNVQFIQLQFTDLLGMMKSLTIPVEHLADSIQYGAWFDGSSIEGFTRIHESDMFLKPDLSTYAVIPWFKPEDPEDGETARLICDVYTPDGKPYEGDPRYILKQTMAEAERMSFIYHTGPELEFFLLKKDQGIVKPVPHDLAGYFDLTTDEAQIVRRAITVALKKFGITIESLHHEVAGGQHEIDLRYAQALKTADNGMTLRYVVKAVAQCYHLHATFMPKPFTGIDGSGMHVHQSLFDSKTNKNVFFEEHNPYHLSDVALQFIAGQLDHVRAMSAILSPTVNSYKRLVPGFEAPVYLSWARLNRSALIRVPQYSSAKTQAARCELRCPDPSANLYLAFAVMLKAGLDGIKRKLTPPKPVEADLYDFSDLRLHAMQIETLPASLGEALEVMQTDPLIKETLGEHTYKKYLEAKQLEWEMFRLSVSDWELKKYLETY